MEGFAFHRAELVRQFDAVRSVQRWYLLPLVPGPLVVLFGSVIEHPERWLARAGVLVAWALLYGVILRLNQRAAVRLEGEIATLDESR
jgi:hypothetical protein